MRVMQLPNPNKYVFAKKKGGYGDSEFSGFSIRGLFGWLLLCPVTREQI
jgi:hypothetical protein